MVVQLPKNPTIQVVTFFCAAKYFLYKPYVSNPIYPFLSILLFSHLLVKYILFAGDWPQIWLVPDKRNFSFFFETRPMAS